MVKGGIWNKVFALKEVLWLDSITMGFFFWFFLTNLIFLNKEHLLTFVNFPYVEKKKNF